MANKIRVYAICNNMFNKTVNLKVTRFFMPKLNYLKNKKTVGLEDRIRNVELPHDTKTKRTKNDSDFSIRKNEKPRSRGHFVTTLFMRKKKETRILGPKIRSKSIS